MFGAWYATYICIKCLPIMALYSIVWYLQIISNQICFIWQSYQIQLNCSTVFVPWSIYVLGTFYNLHSHPSGFYWDHLLGGLSFSHCLNEKLFSRTDSDRYIALGVRKSSDEEMGNHKKGNYEAQADFQSTQLKYLLWK